jgi:hypothetical protein
MLSCLPHTSHFWCAADAITPLARNGSGSARVPRAGEGLWPSRAFVWNRKIISGKDSSEKVRFGATPKPARETRALPTLGMTGTTKS